MLSWLSTHLYVIYLAPILIAWYWYTQIKRRSLKVVIDIQQENLSAGLDQPASLHPIVDPNICIGCGACVKACPESNVLGLINRKAALIAPANCIGHGACKTACPVNGIELVFGTEKRGIEIPQVSPTFETSVQGIYIAGELGGMGLVRNAIEQGKQAVLSIEKSKKQLGRGEFEVIIVGAGPAGLAAALMAQSKGIRYRILEQDTLGGTVAHFPRKKLVMTSPAQLPLAGKMNFKETSKEVLLEFWQGIVDQYQLDIQTGHCVEAINRTADGGFQVITQAATFSTSTVLLCLGRRGTPRKLGVTGEELSKVVYRLTDARQYKNQRVLVVGGGDSAIEAALSLADECGTHVALSYRKNSFSRAKQKNRDKIEQAERDGLVAVYLESEVLLIEAGKVCLAYQGAKKTILNNAVIVCAGGILPTSFLKSIGIEVETKYGTA